MVRRRQAHRFAGWLGAARDERGQSLILVVITMGVIIAFSAFAIDVSSWDVGRHRAQVAADAAALAAANCLANAGVSGVTCTSTTDTTDATTVAQTIARDNGITLATGAVTYGSGSVTVASSTSAPGYFAPATGIGNMTQRARSVASYAPGTTCAADSCDAIWAGDPSCGSSNALVISGLSGTVPFTYLHSNGNLDISGGSPTWLGITYGSSCTATVSGTGPTPVKEAAPAYPVTLSYYPITASIVAATSLAALSSICTGGVNTSTGPWSPPLGANDVYCDVGTGTYNNPATWNGQMSEGNCASDTFITGTFSDGGGAHTCDAANYPSNKLLIWAAGSGNNVVVFSGGGNFMQGDIIVPNGSFTFSGGSGTDKSFIEAYDVTWSGGGQVSSDLTTNNTPSQGTDQLSG